MGFSAAPETRGDYAARVTAFDNQVAIVTGGGSGIGRAMCEQLADARAHVIVVDIDGGKANTVAAGLGSRGARSAEAVRVDVTDGPAVEELVDGVCKQHGRLDYIFNNAGVCIIGDTLSFSMDDWNKLIDVNIRGVVHGTVAAYQRMAKQGHGHIVNTASMAGLVPSPLFTAYALTKHAVVGLSRSLRLEGKEYGVHVSAICPGIIDTPMVDSPRKGIDVDPREHADRFYPVDKCVRDALAGVAKRQDLIVVSPMAKFATTLDRISPWAYDRIASSDFFKGRGPKRTALED